MTTPTSAASSGLAHLEHRWLVYRATLGDVDAAQLARIRQAFFAGILFAGLVQVEQLEALIKEVDATVFAHRASPHLAVRQ